MYTNINLYKRHTLAVEVYNDVPPADGSWSRSLSASSSCDAGLRDREPACINKDTLTYHTLPHHNST